MSESALRFGQLIRYLHWLDTGLVKEAPFTWLPSQKVRVIARSWPLFLDISAFLPSPSNSLR